MKLSRKIIEQLKNGDETQFETIYQTTKKGVYGMIFSILKDHDLTNDVMQDVYMKMLVKINQYQIGKNFMNWLLQIAKYQAIDVYRKEKKSVFMDAVGLDLIAAFDNEKPNEQTDVTFILNVLDLDERMVVVLKVLEDKTHKEISKILDKPLGTVLWIYQKAMDKLKSYMGDIT